MKEFFKTKNGKRLEKYLWEVSVLTLGLVTAALSDLENVFVVLLVPVLNQVTKYINQKYLK